MLLCAELGTQDVDASQHDFGNEEPQSAADWSALFRASWVNPTPPSGKSSSGIFVGGNTSTKEKRARLLDYEDMTRTILYLKQRNFHQVQNVHSGEISGGEYKCKFGCALHKDLCVEWMHDVRKAACVGTCAEMRKHLVNLLRNGNKSADQLPIDTCHVQGVTLCQKCFRQVFKVRMYLTMHERLV